jgi:hypothetical protein
MIGHHETFSAEVTIHRDVYQAYVEAMLERDALKARRCEPPTAVLVGANSYTVTIDPTLEQRGEARLRTDDRRGDLRLREWDEEVLLHESPTRPCPDCAGYGWTVTEERGTMTCPECDGAGTLPRYAIRLTDVEAQP